MKVFWSWQDDWAPKENRFFVQKALELAVEQLGDSFDAAERPELDHDTKGLAGSVEIAKEILKKIEVSAAFVADVTPIGKSEGGKALPNPNVMIELGWALKSPGPGHIIQLINTASGFGPADLPFDIRHRRVMTYHLDQGADAATRKATQAKLVGALRDALKLNLHASLKSIPGQGGGEGVAAASDPSVWASSDAGITHQEWGNQVSLSFPDEPRAYVRVIPCGWKSGKPPAVHIVESLQPTVEAPYGRGSNGSYGACAEGFVRYWFIPTAPETRYVTGIALYFDETGEFWAWMPDPEHFGFLDIRGILRLWASTLASAMDVLDRLGASPTRRVEVGVSRVKQRGWKYPMTNSFARKELPAISLQSDNWVASAQIEFIRQAHDQIRDLYGLGPASDDETDGILKAP